MTAKKRATKPRSTRRPRAATRRPNERWELRLYVAGQTPRSLAAVASLKEICETHLRGNYRIELIDLVANPELARRDEIFAIPTLIRKLPPPMKRIIGDLSDKERTLIGMELIPEA